VYEAGIKNEIEYLYDKGIRSVFVCGSYGAFPLMSQLERIILTKHTLIICKKLGMQVIVHIGHPSLDIAIHLAKMAESLGADAVSSVVPFYYSSTIYKPDTFVRHFETLVNSLDIPVHCYNNPKTTGVNIDLETFKKLLQVGVRGIKDGGADPIRIRQMMKIIKDQEFDYYPSSTSMLINGFLYGAQSCISGVALAAPELILTIYQSLMAHDVISAVELHKEALDVREALGKYSGRAIAAYDVLHAKGVDVGTCRAPWVRLDENQNYMLLEKLKEIGVI
jgi:dihydrodipicolinate synthase/N-acetylneuraminate lyase